MKREVISKTYPDAIAFYKLSLPTGHYYVGSTLHLVKRMRNHRYQLEMQQHYNHKFQSLFSIWSNVKVTYVLCETIEEARHLEQEEINKHYGTELLLNRGTDVNSIWGGVHGMSQEHRKVIGELATNRWKDPVFSIRMRKLMSEQRIGRKLPAEQREKIRLAGIGRTHTEESKLKMRIANKGKNLGKKRDPDAVKRGIETMRLLGKNRQTPESRAKIAKANFKPITINGVRYESLMEAAKAYGITPSGVTYRIKSSSSQFTDWRFD